MPKQKTKRAAAKRYRFTATGKVKVKKAKLRHILTKKSRDAKRGMRKAGYIAAVDVRMAKSLVPYL